MAADVSNPPTNALSRRLVIGVLGLVMLTACGSSPTPPSDTQGGSGPPNGNAGIFNNRSAADLITAIQRNGLPAPNPRNVTTSDCPGIGCVEKIDTDTVSVIKFSTTGKAELYAGSTQHRFQIADVVVTFGPTVSPSQQQQYEQVVTGQIQ
jgi:hypothetical protein